jgi:large subunit ribosomal protein L18
VEHKIDKAWRRERSKHRIRKRVTGTSARPRLVVFRSLQHIYVQAVDDAAGATLAAASTRDQAVRSKVKQGGSLASAKVVGAEIAQKLKEKGLDAAVFDRGGYRYHGRVRALAEAARESGLRF